MVKKIVAFGASNSKNSINKQFAQFVANQLVNAEVTVLDLNDFELPIYSVDREKNYGIHENASSFYKLIKTSDAVIISLAEYNGLHTSAFKNLWDWLSRISTKKPMQIWDNKPMFLTSTSTSKRPMSNVLRVSKELFPHFGAEIIAHFHLPSFNHFFNQDKITESTYLEDFKIQLYKFQTHLNNH